MSGNGTQVWPGQLGVLQGSLDPATGLATAASVVPGTIIGTHFAAAPLPLAQSSLVPSEPDDPAWRVSNPAAAPSIRKLAGAAADGTRSLAWVNADLVSPISGYIERPFTAPPGCTSVAFSAAMQLPGGGTANPVLLQVLDVLGVTVLATVSVTPTGALTTYTTGAAAVTAGTEYRARVVFASAGQGDALVGSLVVAPTGATGVFAAAFQRVPADDRTLYDSNEAGWITPRYASQTEFAHLDLLTDATSIVVEAYNNGSHYMTTDCPMTVLVNGVPYSTFTPAGDCVSYNTVTLPARPKRVSIVSAAQAFPSAQDPTNRGGFLCAVYVPSANSLAAAPAVPPQKDTIVLYGDSKFAGFYSSVPSRDSIAPTLRARGHRVVSECYGGRNLNYDVSTTLTAAACAPFARKLTKCNPSKVIIAIGRNDFSGAAYTLANFTTQLGNLVDQVHAAAPAATVVLVKFTRETSEPNNGNGDTMDSWRAAMDTVASTRSTYCTTLAADQLWTVATAGTYTSDGVHPNDAGQQRLVSALEGFTVAATGGLAVLGEPYAWSPKELGASLLGAWLPEIGTTPAAMSSVVATGTTPPTVTVAGTPTVELAILLAVTTAGARGTAAFRWSMDGGASWVQSNVLTAATTVLPGTGITVSWAVGTYAADNVYTLLTRISSLSDQTTNARPMLQPTAANQFAIDTLTIGGRKRKMLRANGQSCFMSAAALALTQPITIFTVAKLIDQTAVRTLINGAALFFYANTATTMAVHAGAQVQVNVDATALHTYGLVLAGASSEIITDGTSSGLINTGTNGPTGLNIGADVANSRWYWDGWIGPTIVVNGNATAVQRAQIHAWLRDGWRTW